MRFRKVLSVFLATVMLFSVMSIGFNGIAAEIDYSAQYRMLAAALKNEHVRELTNYTITNNTLENGTGGFDSDARGFAYDHKVVAKDNISGDILVASNRFYYIAESLLSYEYGVGCYNAEVLVDYISQKIMPYFESESDAIYEDFFGNRYYPTEEEIEAYDKAVEEILAAELEVDKINLPTYGIEFIEKSCWEYYNTATVLRYFMGNTLKINTGNWYHRFSFIVETSINAVLEGCHGVYNIGSGVITLRTAAYQFEYERFYNESMSKSFFAFKQPSLDTVWQTYGSEYDFDRTSPDLTVAVDDIPGILFGGQAAAYLIKVEYDGGTDESGATVGTVQKLSDAYEAFMRFINQEAVVGAKYTRWDEPFIKMTDAEITSPSSVAAALGRPGQASQVGRWLNDVKKRR